MRTTYSKKGMNISFLNLSEICIENCRMFKRNKIKLNVKKKKKKKKKDYK